MRISDWSSDVCSSDLLMAAEDGTQSEMVVGGRYADQFERRKGEWRLARRLFIHDWNQNGAATVQWDSGLYAKLNVRGRHYRDDPSYIHMLGTNGGRPAARIANHTDKRSK